MPAGTTKTYPHPEHTTVIFDMDFPFRETRTFEMRVTRCRATIAQPTLLH
jgi:hypothetical protein